MQHLCHNPIISFIMKGNKHLIKMKHHKTGVTIVTNIFRLKTCIYKLKYVNFI